MKWSNPATNIVCEVGTRMNSIRNMSGKLHSSLKYEQATKILSVMGKKIVNVYLQLHMYKKR